MTVACIHQNSFVVNVEWSVKFSCSTCTSFLIQNFTIFKKLYCSQHSSEFICRECRMVSENFLVAHALLFYNFLKKHYSHCFFFKKHYLHCFFRSMKHLTQASHPYLQRETTKKWSKKMMK